MKKGLLLAIAATIFISFGSFAIAGQGQGVPQLLGDVITELMNIDATRNTDGFVKSPFYLGIKYSPTENWIFGIFVKK